MISSDYFQYFQFTTSLCLFGLLFHPLTFYLNDYSSHFRKSTQIYLLLQSSVLALWFFFFSLVLWTFSIYLCWCFWFIMSFLVPGTYILPPGGSSNSLHVTSLPIWCALFECEFIFSGDCFPISFIGKNINVMVAYASARGLPLPPVPEWFFTLISQY